MKKRIITLTLLSVVLMVGYLYMDYKYPSGSWRYKLTVTLDTPQGEVSGSAVREITDKTPIISFPESTAPAQEHGEAVVVEMPNGKQLFALIDWNSDQEVYQSFPYPGGYRSSIVYYRSLEAGLKANVPLNAWPQMVTFTDMNDPKTVKKVLETGSCWWSEGKLPACTSRNSDWVIAENNLEKYFGEGVSIKSVTVEITDEPVTRGVVDRYLPKALNELRKNWKDLPYSEKERINPLIRFTKD